MPMPEFNQLCNEAKREIQEIDVEALKTMQKRGDSFELIDVREPDEFARGHLPGAINVPLPRIEQQGLALPAEGGASADRLVFICRSGARSLRACALVRRSAGREVLQLEGGLLAWREAVDPALAL